MAQIFDKSKSSGRERERAEALAIEVLAHVANEPETLERFLSLSGLAPQTLRAAAAEPGFLAGVLDFLAGDEALLLAFAANAGHDPAEIARARAALSPRDEAD